MPEKLISTETTVNLRVAARFGQLAEKRVFLRDVFPLAELLGLRFTEGRMDRCGLFSHHSRND